MKEGNKLKDKLKKVLSLLLTVLMTFSLIQMNQIQNVHAATLYPEADASVTVVANNVNISAFGSTETDLYKIKLGGTSAFCLDYGKNCRTNNIYAKVGGNVNGKIAQVINWYIDQKDKNGYGEEFVYGLAQATIWAIREGKTDDDTLAEAYEKLLVHYASSGASGHGLAFVDLYYKGNGNGNAILEYSTSGSYSTWSYGASTHQKLVTVNSTPDVTYPEIIPARVSATKSYKTSESIKVHINKSDVETSNKLSGIKFDFYKDNVKGGSATTNSNGIAEHTFTTEFSKSATVTKEYCSNYNDLSLPNQALVTGYTSKSAAQAAADAEALAKAKELAEAGSGQEHTYKVVETATKTNYWLNPANNIFEKKLTGAGTVTFDITNKRQQGSITITKRDSETNNLVDQAIYGLYARSPIIHPDGKTGTIFNTDQLVATFPATALDGTSKLSGLYLGQYYIKEITAPSGYLHSSEVYNVDLTYAGQNVEITDSSTTVKDKVQRAKVTSIKQDKELDNGSKNSDIFDFNKDGAQGDATRVKATYGLYAREPITHADGSTGVVTYNQVAGSIHELKSVKGTELSVKNVRATAGTLLATIKTDENGEFGFEHLYNGKYYIKEITPSEGYTLDSTEYDFDLSYTNQDESVVIKNGTVLEQVAKQAFDLFKAGHVPGTSTNAKPLADVEFTVWLESDIQSFINKGKTLEEAKGLAPIYDKLITKADGTASSIELPFGKYRVSETKAAVDYATADDFFVTVTEDSRVHQSWTNNVIVDELFTGLIQAVKLDKETGKQVLLEGAEFKIKNTDTDEYIGYWEWLPFPHYVDSWTTNSEGYVRLQEKMEAGNYHLEEIHAPKGYVLDTEPVTFRITNQNMYEIAEDGKTPVIKAYKSDISVKGKIEIEKLGEAVTDYKDGQFVYEQRGLHNAEYDIYAENPILDPSNDGTVLFNKDELVTTIKTGPDGKGISEELPLGDYYSKEGKAPFGYILSDEIKHFKLEYDNETVPIVYDKATYVNERQKIEVESTKQNTDTEEFVEGAEISLIANRDIYNYDGNIIVKAGTVLESVLTGKDGKAKFNTDMPLDLTPEFGTMPIDDNDNVDPEFNNNVIDGIKLIGNPNSLYLVQETKEPDGYVPFKVNYYFNGEYDQSKDKLIYHAAFFNEQTETEFSKQDATTSKELEGAKLQVIDPATKQVIEEWTSTKDVHIVKGLILGKEYILHEDLAPLGYNKATDIKFTVGEKTKVVMKDEPYAILEKLDKVDNFIVAGNELELRDAATDKVIKNIMTTDEALKITDLITGHDYILREVKQAEGYYINKEEVRFTFAPGMTVKFYNNPILTDIRANKLDSQDMKPVISKDFEFTMYSDPECTNIVKVVNANTEDGTATFKDVRYGTWYIKETKAPIGYKISNEVKKVIVDDNLEGVGDLYSFVYLNTRLPITIIKVPEKPVTGDNTCIIAVSCLGTIGLLGILAALKKRKNKAD